eukprot:1247392-Prymnesium_polylepis.1
MAGATGCSLAAGVPRGTRHLPVAREPSGASVGWSADSMLPAGGAASMRPVWAAAWARAAHGSRA